MKKLLSGSVLMFVLFSVLVTASGLGVAPANLKFENALKGVTTEKKIEIQNPGDQAISVSIGVTGDMKDWIKLSLDRIEVPGKGSVDVIVLLTPPSDKANLEYSSNINIRAESGGNVEGSGMGLLPGISSVVTATITDEEIVDGEVSKIITRDTYYGDPIKILIGFTNKGNIPIGPDIIVEIEKRGSGIVDSVEKKLEEIKPYSSKDYEIEIESDGKETDVFYRANVGVLIDGRVIEQKDGIMFKVLEKTISEKEGPKVWVGVLIAVIIVVSGFIVFYFLMRK